MNLTDRQWNQIKAALMLWKELLEHTSRDPAMHPTVTGMFKQYAPLTVKELEELLEPSPATCHMVTIAQAAKEIGVSGAVLERVVRMNQLPPDFQTGTIRAYRASRLAEAYQNFVQVEQGHE